MSAGGRLRRVLSLLVLARVAALGVSPAAKLSRMQGILHVCSQLEEDWASLSAASPHLRFAQIGSAAHAGASSIHGRGLFAARRLGVGEVVAFYPVHTLGDSTHAFELAPRDGDGALESGTLESGTLQTRALENGALETTTLEGGTLESGTLESATLETGALESGTLETGALEGSPRLLFSVDGGSPRLALADAVAVEVDGPSHFLGGDDSRVRSDPSLITP